MALLAGGLLAVTVGLMATAVGLDRDRALYPTVTIVIASNLGSLTMKNESGREQIVRP